MHRQNNTTDHLFGSSKGVDIYNRIVNTIDKEGMSDYINRGVLVGFSGGADSVFLLSFLVHYKRLTNGTFPLLAVHVNHCLRGDEADRDEEFSREFCKNSEVDFLSIKIDVPSIKQNLCIGTEEAARIARYSTFDNIIQSRNDISTIAVAHNATDNAETVIMNMLRGSGLSGVCGIKPVRDNIIRPIISISKPEIVSLLDDCGVAYVTDSTNLSLDYTRNYVRNQILPLFSRLSDTPELSITRMTENLRLDLDYITKQAKEFISNELDSEIRVNKLRDLHPSIQSKVVSMLVFEKTGHSLEEKHISALRDLIKADNFTYSLPGDMNFCCQRGLCFFSSKKTENTLDGQIFSLSTGENKISGTNLTVYIGEFDKSSSNVYNFSIQAHISSAIICDGLTLRFKKDGDSYKYSGITHKLKKVFNDRNIPPKEREYIPVLCDSQGIVLVPGMSTRDGAKSDISTENVPITFVYSLPGEGETELFTALLRK